MVSNGFQWFLMFFHDPKTTYSCNFDKESNAYVQQHVGNEALLKVLPAAAIKSPRLLLISHNWRSVWSGPRDRPRLARRPSNDANDSTTSNQCNPESDVGLPGQIAFFSVHNVCGKSARIGFHNYCISLQQLLYISLSSSTRKEMQDEQFSRINDDKFRLLLFVDNFIFILAVIDFNGF